jgi:hypothetical protein
LAPHSGFGLGEGLGLVGDVSLIGLGPPGERPLLPGDGAPFNGFGFGLGGKRPPLEGIVVGLPFEAPVSLSFGAKGLLFEKL